MPNHRLVVGPASPYETEDRRKCIFLFVNFVAVFVDAHFGVKLTVALCSELCQLAAPWLADSSGVDVGLKAYLSFKLHMSVTEKN